MRPLLERFNIVSGWSTAVHDVDGNLLGTLGLYHPYMREPDEVDWQAISAYADVAAIAIMVDRRRALTTSTGELGPIPTQPVGTDRLTHREQEIVSHLLSGNRVPAIARMMYLSPSTVRNYLSSAFHKLTVGSQQELIDLYRRETHEGCPTGIEHPLDSENGEP